MVPKKEKRDFVGGIRRLHVGLLAMEAVAFIKSAFAVLHYDLGICHPVKKPHFIQPDWASYILFLWRISASSSA
jgi:hypothetical protein